MDKYSKFNIMGHSQNSRSMDFSDLLSFSRTPKSNLSNPTKKIQEISIFQMNKNSNTQDQQGDHEEDQTQENIINSIKGERFGNLVLKRNSSVSSSSSASVSGFQSAVKGAFSMRRSSSVTERYCRIHDQSTTTLASPIDDDEDQDEAGWGTTRSTKKKQKGGKILKACKRFFGL